MMTAVTYEQTKPLQILLVEDNLSHAKLVRRGLEKHQIENEITHVFDGEQALDYLYQRGSFAVKDNAPEPQLILLDLRLPKIDGIEVLKQVKTDKKLKHIPIVILTTSERRDDLGAAYNNYANSYLVKPTNLEDFKSLLYELGIYWLACNKNYA
jgi:CheY-like chemotaxis protein